MKRHNHPFLFSLLLAAVVITCNSGAFAFYIPVAPTLKGIGNASVQAIEADMRALEQAALLFRSENPSAGSLPKNVNHVELLAPYTDIPGRFGDVTHYAFFSDERGWWIGAAVPGGEARSSAAQAAPAHEWFGSPNATTAPGSAFFGGNDGFVWKLLR
ncbi:MAG: hypothetical protein LBR61_12440 [Synergistaceae bacterium]|jgi:hypothetical protein|nr:hypothetical protein [Synergistaceae bacterium]